jgi:hypothetical protein
MNKDKKSINLIEKYLDKQEDKARLITVAELALKLFQKADAPSTTESEVGKRLRGQREKKNEASGHALFPHLRPMYRTVHRRKPRELVFRAIRWVNPARMFPISQYDKKKLQSLSEEEFEEAFSELAKYRREAAVINNRYGQMINMIDSGQLPYYIPFAEVPEQRFADLQQYRDRAERLGKGASDWGWELDNKAEEFRQVFEQRFQLIDSIDGLWTDGPPPFMRVREGRKNQKLMRAQRQYHDRFAMEVKMEDGEIIEAFVAAEGEKEAKEKFFDMLPNHDFEEDDVKAENKGRVKLPRQAQVNVREFVAVPAEEVRAGEENRMPKAREVDGARVFLLRHPVGLGRSVLGDQQYTNAIKAGQVKIGPKGNKINLVFEEGDWVEPEVRRLHRWTQRGLAPHRGAASEVSGGHEAARSRQQQVDLFGRPAPQVPEPQPKGPVEEPTINEKATDKNNKIVSDMSDAFSKHNINPDDLALDPEKDVFDAEYMNDSESYESVELIDNIQGQRGGINGGTTMVVKMKDGSKWVWKATRGEQYAELATWALANAIQTQITPKVQIGMVPWDALPDQFKRSGRGQSYFRDQGGHFMRWEDAGGKGGNVIGQHNNDTSKKLMDTSEKRQRMWALTVIDSFTGNQDRHGGNAVVDANGGIVAIDSGFADGWHRTGWEDDGIFRPFAFGRVAYGNSTKRALGKSISDGSITADQVRDEARQWFRDSWNAEALSDVASAFVGQRNAPNNLGDITEDDFMSMIDNNYL